MKKNVSGSEYRIQNEGISRTTPSSGSVELYQKENYIKNRLFEHYSNMSRIIDMMKTFRVRKFIGVDDFKEMSTERFDRIKSKGRINKMYKYALDEDFINIVRELYR